jgi:hypothetical protein
VNATIPAPTMSRFDIGDRVRIVDHGIVRKVNISSDGTALAVLVECEGSGDAVWLAPEMLSKVGT